MGRLAAALALAAAVVCGSAGVASAHAELDAAVPADGATVATAPSQVRLTFSEPVQASPAIGVRLFRADGTELAGVRTRASGQVVVGELPAGAGAGTFLVRWRALSDDGHVVKGALTYTVAAAAAVAGVPIPAVPSPDVVPSPDAAAEPVTGRVADGVRAVAETVSAAGVVLLLGGLTLWWLVGPARLAVPRTQSLVGAVALLAGGVVALVAVAARTGGSAGAIASGEPWREVFATPSGQALAVRALTGATAAALVAARRYRAALGLGLVAGVALPLAGHASSDRVPVLAGALLVAHVTAAAVWAGAVVAVVPMLRATRRDELRAALPATTLLAIGGVVVLLASGAIQAGRRLPGWSALTGTGYGVALLVKTGLVAAVLVLGAVGLRAARTPSALSSPSPSPSSPSSELLGRLRVTLPAEVALLAVAVAVAGALSTLRPPTASSASTATAAEPAADDGAAPVTGATVATQVVTRPDGRAALRLRSAPGALGLDLDVTGPSGTPEDVVAVVFAQPAGTVLPARPIPLQRVATGRFTADAVTLTSPGTAPPAPTAPTAPTRWELTVTLTRPDGRRETFALPAAVP